MTIALTAEVSPWPAPHLPHDDSGHGVRDTASVANWLRDEDAARWAAFPSDVVPRPIVLLESRVRVEGGFVDSDSKLAWMAGGIELKPLSPALSALLPRRRRAYGGPILTVTEVASTTAAFTCDRGPRQLEAYRLQVTGLYGFCIILSPTVECWWAVGQPDRQRLGEAALEDDGVTIHFPAYGGALTEFHGAEFQEHDSFVVGRAITSERPVPPGTAIHAIGKLAQPTGQLTTRLGARVLVGTDGQPLPVTNTRSSG